MEVTYDARLNDKKPGKVTTGRISLVSILRLSYFFAPSKYFRSGGGWPFLIGMMVPSPLR